MIPHIFWNTRDWAEAISTLPVEGPLPTRTVLVPRERVAHALRRELLRTGHPQALAGTRFVTLAGAAIELLGGAGVDFTPGEDALRPARLLALFRTSIRLEHFSLALFRAKPGWDEALTRTINDLEGAGLTPVDLERESRAPGTAADTSAKLRDVATMWRVLDESAGRSWSLQRLYREAASLLERQPALWPFPGPTLATASGGTTAAEARLIRAIPGATLGTLAARPMRTHYLARLAALFGQTANAVLQMATPPHAAGSERDLLASYLFEPPERLADPSRPRSAGPDGTVDLEEHAGVEAEVEATADWVARQVMDGTPLEDIAVLAPVLDPLAGLVAERLARLPWHEGSMPVHVAGGLPLTGTAAGARALAVVRALRSHVSGEALASVLPALKTVGTEARHLSHGAATDLVWSLGTAGGNAARPDGALEWAERSVRRTADLAEQLERARQAEDDPERSGLARRARDLERLLHDLRAVRPALAALVGVARHVVDAAPLATLWPALRDFLAEWLLQPGEGPRVHQLLDDRLAPATADLACGSLTGDDALRVVEDTIGAIRLPTGRFGEPAVYVGTIGGAVGLPVRALRVIGLAEGHLPAQAHPDPVLPDLVRARLAPTLPTIADHALDVLHAFDAVVRNAEARVALSAPRLDVERSQREPAAVMLEAAAALGRPDAATGAGYAGIPDLRALRRDAFAPARRATLAFRRTLPLGEAAWQDGVALGALGCPGRWRDALALDLDRIEALAAHADAAALDGILGAACASVPVPGLGADRPISPSDLQKLLECPHRYLFERVLRFDEPAGAPTLREIGQPQYGSLFHLVAERFYRAHGTAFAAHEGSLPAWLHRAGALVEQTFVEFLEGYPLVGGAVRVTQRERLRGDVRDLLQYDWDAPAGRRFVDVERVFGRPTAVELPLGSHSLFVRGQIDRLDVEGGITLVRDLKTGRAHPRLGKEAAPDPSRDVQIAVYGLVAQRLAREWGVPPRVGAAYAYFGRGPDERAFRKDFHQALEPAALEWLTVAANLLAERSFPRTPDKDDCAYCPFRPVCGDDIHERAAQLLTVGAGVAFRFGAIKGIGAERADDEAED